MTDPYASQRRVLGALLEAHPHLIGTDELTARLADVPRVREALKVLIEDGLATKLGERVGVSRPVVRYRALGPV